MTQHKWKEIQELINPIISHLNNNGILKIKNYEIDEIILQNYSEENFDKLKSYNFNKKLDNGYHTTVFSIWIHDSFEKSLELLSNLKLYELRELENKTQNIYNSLINKK